MQSIIDLYKNSESLHHAYFFVEHKMEELVVKLEHFFENIVGIKTAGNPDFWRGQFQTFTIDDARAITERQERAAFTTSSSKPNKIFIIQTENITEEAQNALLKVFEEPTLGTHFFIISPQDILLPTLRSRMHVVQPEDIAKDTDSDTDGDKTQPILNMKIKERLTKVKEITDGITDENKTKQDAITLLNKIESELYQKGAEKNSEKLLICERARASLYDRGAPVKMILENLMLSV